MTATTPVQPETRTLDAPGATLTYDVRPNEASSELPLVSSARRWTRPRRAGPCGPGSPSPAPLAMKTDADRQTPTPIMRAQRIMDGFLCSSPGPQTS